MHKRIILGKALHGILSATSGAWLPAEPLENVPVVVGKPCLFSDYFAEWRSFPAILKDPEGNLTCGGNRLNHGGATQAPPAAGALAFTATRRDRRDAPQCHFTYRDAAGNVHDLWFDRYRERDRWHAEQLNAGGRTWAPAAAGDPSGVEAEQVFRVAYRDRDGGIQEIWNDGAWRSARLNLDGATAAPGAAGDPVQLSLPGERHVFYRDAGGGVQDLRCDGGWQAARVVPADGSGAPPAAGEPSVVRVGRVLHLAYRDLEGGIQHFWFDRGWHRRQLNGGGPGATGAPRAAGDPCLRLADGRALRATYRDLDGNLQDLQFEGGWRVRRLNNGGLTGAPPAASDPVALVPPSNWEFVAYVDVAGNAQLLSHFLDNPWQASWLNGPERRAGASWAPAEGHGER